MLNNINTNIIIKLILLLLLNSIVSAKNYYVKNGGNNANSGLSDSQAWSSIDKVINFSGFVSGDIVSFKRGDTFYISGGLSNSNTSLRAPVDGMTLNSYGSGNRPVISGNGNYAAFRMSSAYAKNNIKIIGLEFRDGRTASGTIGSTAAENGVTFIFDGNYLTLDDCLFDGSSSFENCAIGASTSNKHISNVIITNCIFQNTQMRAGLYINDCDDVLIENCIFRNNSGYDSYEKSYEGSGLKFNDGHDTGGGNCENVIVRDNWFENNHRGWLDGSTKNSEFYNNVVISKNQPITGGTCILISSGEHQWGPENVNIHNNTIIQKRSSVQSIAIKFFQASGGKPYKSVSYNNNIVYVEDGGTGDTKYFVQIHTDAEDPRINSNLWYSGDNAIRWYDGSNGGATTSFSSWKNMGYDNGGKNADPLFENYTNNDFSLKEGSPAIELNAGVFENQPNVLIPVSAFNVDDRTPLTTQSVAFTDASTNSPTSWQWTFSPSSVSFVDGTSSTSRNPHVKFNAEATYTVTLSATNSAGSDNEVKSNYITATVPISPPVAAFSSNNLTPITTQTVTFTDASTNSPTSWQWTFSPTTVTYMDGTSSTSRNPQVKFNSAVAYSCTLKVTNSNGTDEEVKQNYISVASPIPSLGIKVSLSVILAGCYSDGEMKTSLNSKGFLPNSQPYNIVPWRYLGSESEADFTVDIVDWVLIELRTDVSASSSVVTKAALVKSDGIISSVIFPTVYPGDYYVVIKHRNHLSIMSANKINLSMNYTYYNFSDLQSKAYGSTPMKDLGNGFYGMYSGDGNADGVISEADIQDIWIPAFLNGIDSYQAGDFDLDGSVTAVDNNINWLPNRNQSEKVPN